MVLASPAVSLISMKVTVKTVKGAATSYEVERDMKVISTGRLGCAVVPGATLVYVVLESGLSSPARFASVAGRGLQEADRGEAGSRLSC